MSSAIPLSSVYVEGTITDSLGVVSEIDSQLVTNVSAPISFLRALLVTGTNTITIPSGARGCIIICKALCDSIKTLKGVAGDTGIVIFSDALGAKNSGTVLLTFGASPGASFVISCVLGVTPDADYTEFYFF